MAMMKKKKDTAMKEAAQKSMESKKAMDDMEKADTASKFGKFKGKMMAASNKKK